jgi:hypothetical protein
MLGSGRSTRPRIIERPLRASPLPFCLQFGWDCQSKAEASQLSLTWSNF